ncbi:20680_t:CDS:2, partial [Gigaspora rosea]
VVPEELKCLAEVADSSRFSRCICVLFTWRSIWIPWKSHKLPNTTAPPSINLGNAYSAPSVFRRAKIEQALYLLKANKWYYKNIDIYDNDADVEFQGIMNDVSDNYTDNDIICKFVSAPAPSHNEQYAINNILTRIQAENNPVIWPKIKGTPINEFNTPGYIACAFPTLYPTGKTEQETNKYQ